MANGNNVRFALIRASRSICQSGLTAVIRRFQLDFSPSPCALRSAQRTFPTFTFRASLTQHPLAVAAHLLLRCSACRRTGRSTASIWPKPRPHPCRDHVGPASRGTRGPFRNASTKDRNWKSADRNTDSIYDDFDFVRRQRWGHTAPRDRQPNISIGTTRSVSFRKDLPAFIENGSFFNERRYPIRIIFTTKQFSPFQQ